MAKNKKAQILAAVMCAATVAGVSPAISSAADNQIISADSTSSSVTAKNNGTVTVDGNRFEVVTSDTTSFIVNNVGTIAIKNKEVAGANVFTVDKSGNIWTDGNINGKNINLSNNVGSIDTLTGNRLLSAKDANGTEYFFVRQDGLIGSKDNAGKVVFQVQNGAITAESLKVNQDIQLADGTSLQGMADTVKGIDANGNIPNIAGIRRTDDNFNAPGEATTTIEDTLTVDGTANKVSMNNGTFEIAKDEGNDQATKTDVKAGYVGITNKNGTEVFAVDYSGNMVLRDTDEAIQTDVKPGYIKISKNGAETFAVDSSGVVKAANGKFGVNATGDVTANSINAANGRFTGTVTAKDITTDTINVAEGQFIADEDGISAADGKFTVNGLGEVTAKAGVDDNSIFRLTENGVEMQSGKTALNVTSGGVEVRGINGATYINGNEINTGTVLANEMYIGSKADENAVATIGDINTTVAEATENTKGIERDEATGTTTIENNTSISKDGITYKGENGLSTTIDGNGIAVGDKTFIKDGEITTGNINVGSINGKDVSDLASNADVAGLKDRVGTVETDVKGIKEDIGDVNAIDGEIKGDNIVSSINNEVNTRRSEISRIDNDIKHLDNRVGSLEDRMGDVEDRIDKVGAMAAAIANLRTMGYDPEAPTEIAVGVGQYESETGLALGVFHYPNQDFMLSASISTSGDEVMGGIGATWKIGRKSAAEKARSVEEKRVAKAEEMQEMAKAEKVKAQRERHAQMLAEREAAK